MIALGLSIRSSGQVVVTGRIRDNDTRLPLGLASVTDRNTGNGTLTGDNGYYSIQVNRGDWLVFSFIGYGPDSAQVNYAIRDSAIVMVYLRKSAFSLSGVVVNGHTLDYQRDSAERHYLFNSTLDQQRTQGLGAVLHPISGLYDLLSKKQRRIWKFQKMFNSYENRQYVLSRIRISVVRKLTGFSDGELKRFLNWYRPDYNYVRNATDYELYEDIKAASIEFRDIPVQDSIASPPEQ